MYVPKPVVETPPPPPVAVIVIVASVPDAVAVTPDPTKLIDVTPDATLVPSSLMITPLPPPPVGADGTHDDPFHVSTLLTLGPALETLDRSPKF